MTGLRYDGNGDGGDNEEQQEVGQVGEDRQTGKKKYRRL